MQDGSKELLVTGKACLVLLSCLSIYSLVRRSKKQSKAVYGLETFKCGTRKSKLAMIQTEYVQERLQGRINVEIREGINSSGDQNLAVSLKDLATKTPGLFTKELEDGLFAYVFIYSFIY